MHVALYLAGLLALLLLVGGWTQFHADIPLEELKQDYAPPPSKFMMMDGATLHYRDEGTGFPVILVPGMSSSLHTWQGWTEILSKQYRVIRMDLPGFGLTGPASNNDYTVPYYESFMARFLDQLEIKECYMAGNSLGGLITWNYALHHPAQVKKIVLIDAAGYPIKRLPLVVRLAKNKILRSIVLHITPRFMIARTLGQVYGDPAKITAGVTDRYFKLMLRAGNRAAFIAFINGFHDSDTEPIRQIKTPTLIEWGEKDRWIPLKDAKNFNHDIAGSTLVTYPCVGHIPMEEIPQLSCMDAIGFFDLPTDTSKTN